MKDLVDIGDKVLVFEGVLHSGLNLGSFPSRFILEKTQAKTLRIY